MIYLAIISFAVFLIYCAVSLSKLQGIPESLSATYYIWPKWVFPSLIVFMAFTLLPCWLEITEGKDGQFLSFLACAWLLFIATVPDYKNDLGQFQIHMVLAYLTLGTALLAITIVSNNWWIVPQWIIVICLCNWRHIKTKYIWLIETAVIGATYMNVILNL